MRDYQRKNNNMYRLPKHVYRETLEYIRDYYEAMSRMDDILVESPSPPDGMPSGSNLSNEPAQKAERRGADFIKTTIISESLLEIPEEYRSGVWNNIHHQMKYPDDANRNTYGYWKAKYIYTVAVRAGKIHKKQI